MPLIYLFIAFSLLFPVHSIWNLGMPGYWILLLEESKETSATPLWNSHLILHIFPEMRKSHFKLGEASYLGEGLT